MLSVSHKTFAEPAADQMGQFVQSNLIARATCNEILSKTNIFDIIPSKLFFLNEIECARL